MQGQSRNDGSGLSVVLVQAGSAIGAHDVVERDDAQQSLHVGAMHHRQQRPFAHQTQRGVERMIRVQVRNAGGEYDRQRDIQLGISGYLEQVRRG